MKVIPQNLITAVSASSENANYPADNLLDRYPKHLFKSAGPSVTLTFTISGGASSGFALFNTNATGVSFQLFDPNAIAWETGDDFESGVAWDNDTLTVTEITALDGVSGACMCQWAEINAAVTLQVTLSNSNGETLFAGVAVGGLVYTYSGPDYGMEEGEVDYSIENELSNGTTDIKQRDIARTFDLQVNIPRDTDWHEFSNLSRKVIKSQPTAWLVTNLNNSRWLVYARITKQKRPSGKLAMFNRVRARLSLLEVL